LNNWKTEQEILACVSLLGNSQAHIVLRTVVPATRAQPRPSFMHSAPGEPLFTKKVEKQNPEKIGLNGDFQGKALPQVCEV
jgi:hypothetical protein